MSDCFGLIFDVDGVIADTEAVNARASIRVFEELLHIEGVERADFKAGLGMGAEAYVRAAAEVHGVKLTAEQVELATKVRQENFLEILANEPLSAFPGVLELIGSALTDPRWRVAIGTSSTREKSEAVLKSVSVPYDQVVYITGDDVTKKKPDPELFLTVAERIRIAPSRCVVIEDAPNGIEAALAAGMKCVAVTNSTTADKLANADLVVNSLADIDLSILERVVKTI